ncbi:LOW QUALITY PROTEIN: hypothetical protein TorRG33x02_102480 [Trema orientale]|uniref:Uncharacterized protein n=1 Tax=Trema orientale TaxID=63057 RepID=A0A2P5F7T0_TREOI|nr:LOW QUALITY PROTEIN: hypothetical protein TorRG33x02_102480 [Trema orientale]
MKCPNKKTQNREIEASKRYREKKSPKIRTHLRSGGRVKLLLRDNNGPGLPCFAEHLLGLEELTLFENHVPYVLGRCGGGVKDLLDSIDEGHGDLRWLIVGAALDEDLTSGIGFLGFSGIALRQEL